ncbi:MAG: membrane protease YdiL (CAAX protease family) [Halobacteriales archaeon]|jgi:membrane protease YdiL (CAAX protease family)
MTVPREIHPRRIGVFLLVAFGFSWLIGGFVYATGGLSAAGEGGAKASTVTLSLIAFMFGPGLGHLAVRIMTSAELSIDAAWLRPRFRYRYKWYAAAWLLPAVLILAGVAVFYAVFPQYLDLSMETYLSTLGEDATSGSRPAAIAVSQLIAAITIGTAINTFVAFGEEFGWRGFLLQHLLPIGTRPGIVMTGAIWGIWHWPIVAMGHNYGLEYTGAPWLGLLATVWMTVLLGTVFAWVTLRSGSVWPAAIAHGTVNAVAGFGILFQSGEPSPLLGPSGAGTVVLVPYLVAASILLWKEDATLSLPEPILEGSVESTGDD